MKSFLRKPVSFVFLVSFFLLSCNLLGQVTPSPQAATLTPVSVLPTGTFTPPPTPDLRVLNPENQHRYLLVDLEKTWSEAVSDCASRGAHLATIQSDAENLFVFGLTRFTWLGGTDEGHEGTWVWITGEPWEYTNWVFGEPNNHGETGEHYLSFSEEDVTSTYLWNDLPGDTLLPFVCEWEPTAAPLHAQVTLGALDYEESGKGPDYTIVTHTPLLAGPDDLRLATFNRQMAALVQQEIDAFKQGLSMLPVEPIGMGSYLEINFERVSPPGNLLSLKFYMNFYSDGAAHPGTYSRTATYDLEAGTFLTLDRLFLPGADYLAVIADYCLAQLRAGPVGGALFEDGAQPRPENYANWNVAADGLLITFDAYQVAAYAAGPQLVTVPYAELQSIVDPQGPLDYLLP